MRALEGVGGPPTIARCWCHQASSGGLWTLLGVFAPCFGPEVDKVVRHWEVVGGHCLTSSRVVGDVVGDVVGRRDMVGGGWGRRRWVGRRGRGWALGWTLLGTLLGTLLDVGTSMLGTLLDVVGDDVVGRRVWRLLGTWIGRRGT